MNKTEWKAQSSAYRANRNARHAAQMAYSHRPLNADLQREQRDLRWKLDQLGLVEPPPGFDRPAFPDDPGYRAAWRRRTAERIRELKQELARRAEEKKTEHLYGPIYYVQTERELRAELSRLTGKA